jgi:hypothetical protein
MVHLMVSVQLVAEKYQAISGLAKHDAHCLPGQSNNLGEPLRTAGPSDCFLPPVQGGVSAAHDETVIFLSSSGHAGDEIFGSRNRLKQQGPR